MARHTFRPRGVLGGRADPPPPSEELSQRNGGKSIIHMTYSSRFLCKFTPQRLRAVCDVGLHLRGTQEEDKERTGRRRSAAYVVWKCLHRLTLYRAQKTRDTLLFVLGGGVFVLQDRPRFDPSNGNICCGARTRRNSFA